MSLKEKHPCVLYRLEEGDEGYDKGACLRIDLLNPDDQFFFFTEAGAGTFMTEHGLQQVNEPEMVRLRKAMAS